MSGGDAGPRIAVVDQGSSATKGAVVDAAGRIVERTERPIGRRVADGRIEHDPLEIARSVEEVLRELGRQGAVDGIALACQRSTCLLWDREDGRPLTPAASWQDRRAAGAADRLELDHGDEIRRLTGLPPSAHYAGTKLAALLDERPEARRAAERGEVVAGTLDAFLVQRLTGTASTEPGQAGRTLLYDLEADAWSGKLARLLDVPFAALPTLAPSAGERGRVGGLPLLALLGDQQAALLGQGGDRAPIAVVHFGTGAFILVATGDRLVRHPRLSSAVLASTRRERAFQIEGSVNSAGSAVDWAADLLGLDLEAWGDRLVDPRSAPWLLPAFAGVGAPGGGRTPARWSPGSPSTTGPQSFSAECWSASPSGWSTASTPSTRRVSGPPSCGRAVASPGSPGSCSASPTSPASPSRSRARRRRASWAPLSWATGCSEHRAEERGWRPCAPSHPRSTTTPDTACGKTGRGSSRQPSRWRSAALRDPGGPG